MKDEGKRLGHMFGEPFRTIVDATQADGLFRLSARDKKPFRHDLGVGPIVFLGDSNHAVSPYAGHGASLALKDGWDLADQICRADSLADAVKAYDAISVPRSREDLEIIALENRYGPLDGAKVLLFRAFLGVGGFMLWLTGKS